MNQNRQLLRVVSLDLHGPAIEVLDAMLARRINIRVKVPKTATVQEPSKSVSFEVVSFPVNEKSPAQDLAKEISDTVLRYNAKRKKPLKASGLKIQFSQVKGEKDGE